MRNRLAAAATVLLGTTVLAGADPVPRETPVAGSVIARKSGEEARFIEVGSFQTVDVRQDLRPGDVLRTNAGGNLAILFSDRTQVRLGRNSTMVVKSIGGAGEDTQLALESGQLWARAERGGDGVTVATPAATAAIRGTDWTLSVGEGGETTLAVFEGRVEIANAQGTVTAAQGEGARVGIGQAPTKYTLVNLDEREQLLLYSDLRSIFSEISVSGLSAPATRAQRDRLSAQTGRPLTPAERVSLAESLLPTDGQAAAIEALAPLSRPIPDRRLEARAKLVEALAAGRAGRFADAERLFAEAAPSLPFDRRNAAALGRWLAGALARPDEPARQPPSFPNDPALARAELSVAARESGPAETLRLALEAEKRFPRDAALPAEAAQLAIELDRREEAAAALARARAIDAEDPAFLLAEARFRAAFLSDLDAARAALQRATAIAPGDDAAWNELGIVQDGRNAPREADAAYRSAVSLDPDNAALRANYARFLLDREQVAAAKEQIDRAEALDPDSYAVLAAKGRYLLQVGRTEEGRTVLLQATAVNPTYGDALIGQAIAAYQQGDGQAAAQALDNADRFEPANYAAPLIRSGIAVDEFRADEAIASAREALRRRQSRGGFFSGLTDNRQTGSYVGVALDLIELDEWGRFYRDRSFDPFLGSSYVDEAADGRISPFAGTPALQAPDERTTSGSTGQASILQATLLDPFSIANQTRRNTLNSQFFNELTVGGGILVEDGAAGWRGDITGQGRGYTPLPYSYSVQAELARPDNADEIDGSQEITGGLFTIGLKPTLFDNIAIFGSSVDVNSGFPGQAQFPSDDTTENRFSNLGIGWSHTLAERNVVQAFVSGSRSRSEQNLENAVAFFDPPRSPDDPGIFGPYTLEQTGGSESVTAGAAQLFGVGPVTVRYGAEGNWSRSRVSQLYTAADEFESLYRSAEDERARAGRLYGDALWQAGGGLTFEAGLWATRFGGDPAPLEYVFGDPPLSDLDAESTIDDGTRLDGRFGIAWAPAANHYLRAFYREDTQFSTNDTLSPISTVGLAPLDLPLVLGGETRTAGLRWDAEWNERFFTSVGYQHLEVNGLAVDTPGFVDSSFTASDGTIDRLDLAANYWIGNGVGAFATLALNQSRDRDYEEPFNDGGLVVEDGLPLVPDYLGRIGLSYVSPLLFKATVAQTFVGRRVGAPFGITIDPYSTTDASLTFLTEDRHFEVELQALNLFDEDFDVAFGVPGPGQTFSAVLRARF